MTAAVNARLRCGRDLRHTEIGNDIPVAISRNIIRLRSTEANAMKNDPSEIEVRLWPLTLRVRGENAITAMRWPLVAVLVAIAICIAYQFKTDWIAFP